MRDFGCKLVPKGMFGWFELPMFTLPEQKLKIIPDVFHMRLRLASPVMKTLLLMMSELGFSNAVSALCNCLSKSAGKSAKFFVKKLKTSIEVSIKHCNHTGVYKVCLLP